MRHCLACVIYNLLYISQFSVKSTGTHSTSAVNITLLMIRKYKAKMIFKGAVCTFYLLALAVS